MALWSELKIKLIATGDETGTWGETTNANFNNVIEQAITGSATVTFADADVTLALIDSTDLQDARALRLNLTGIVTAPRTLYVPAIQKFYIINNDLSEAITVQNATGDGVTIPGGRSSFVFNTNTDVVNPNTYFEGAVFSNAAVILGGAINSTPVGNLIPDTGAFTTLEASSTVSGDGFDAYLASPPAIGSTAANTGEFTDLTVGTTSANTVTMNAGTMSIPNNLVFDGTGAIRLPVGTTAEEPTGVTGMIRYNTSIGNFEGYKATFWDTLGGSNLTNTGFWQNIQTISGAQTISAGYNANSVGPITIAAGGSVTVPTGSRWLIL